MRKILFVLIIFTILCFSMCSNNEDEIIAKQKGEIHISYWCDYGYSLQYAPEFKLSGGHVSQSLHGNIGIESNVTFMDIEYGSYMCYMYIKNGYGTVTDTKYKTITHSKAYTIVSLE